MIINGGDRRASGFFAWHLGNAEKNENVLLSDIRGLASKDIQGCFQEMETVASGTRCKNWFYHANLNPCEDEQLTVEQWAWAIDRLEKELGLEGHARFVVEHEKKGRTHRHVVWSRIDTDKMRAVNIAHNYRKHEQVSRAVERKFGLEKVQNVFKPEREGERPERRPEAWETFRGQEKGLDVDKMKKEITELWRSADSPEAFVVALQQNDYVLAKGDRRNFCIVDKRGDSHSLARRIAGWRAKTLDEKLAGIDRDSLPTVKEAADLQRKLQREKRTQSEKKPQKLARDVFKEQLDAQINLTREMQDRQARLDQYKAALAQEAKLAKQEKARRQEETKGQDITNAAYRYAAALGDHYDIRDPYQSLAKAAMTEYGQFIRERQQLDREIAQEKNPEKRRVLELRRDIEGAEYMAITSERIAGQSEVITGRTGPEAQQQREKAKIHKERALTLRKEYQALGVEWEGGWQRSDPGGNRKEENVVRAIQQPKQEDGIARIGKALAAQIPIQA